jgi:hypothetical protein
MPAPDVCLLIGHAIPLGPLVSKQRLASLASFSFLHCRQEFATDRGIEPIPLPCLKLEQISLVEIPPHYENHSCRCVYCDNVRASKSHRNVIDDGVLIAINGFGPRTAPLCPQLEKQACPLHWTYTVRNDVSTLTKSPRQLNSSLVDSTRKIPAIHRQNLSSYE